MTARTFGIGLILLCVAEACTLSDALRERVAPGIYVLDLPRNVAASRPEDQKKPKILVSAPEAWPGFTSLEIAYTREPNRIEFYAHSEWADTPAQMIGPLLIRALEDSGRFAAVLSPGKGVAADFRLDSEIVKIQQEFNVSPSIGRVELRIQLIDLSNARVVGTRTFQATVPAPTDDPAGGVEAINRALSMVFDQILAYFDEVMDHSITGTG
ncbi:MAG: ABC-type transport auxiliary lipoprotein family protein [Gammaproteobacteria bacterium]